MSEITLVTAYFDIGRGFWKKQERDNNKYIKYFKFWARIKNKLIIYTTKEFKEEIWKIRKNFGLQDKTKIIVIDDFRNFDREMYNKIKRTMCNELSKTFYFNHDINRPEVWNWEYNYVVMLKFYCMLDVVKNRHAEGMLAWIDFGFNHGGNDGIINPKEFEFKWEYNFTNKIHLFISKEIDDRPVFDIIKSLDVYIRGNIMIAPDFLWEDYFFLIKESMLSLLRCGLCDDDQTIELMAYRENPEIFEMHRTNSWIDSLVNYSKQNFTINKKKNRNNNYKYYKYRSKVFISNGYYRLGIIYYARYLNTKFFNRRRVNYDK